MAKVSAELGTIEGKIESIRRRHAVTGGQADAAMALKKRSEYSTRLAEAASQRDILEGLREYVDNPENGYQIIPSHIGLTDKAANQLIANYNKAVQERNRLLLSASELSPQVQTLTAAVDGLQADIKTALTQAVHSADIRQQGIMAEYSKYQSRVANVPVQQRMLFMNDLKKDVLSKTANRPDGKKYEPYTKLHLIYIIIQPKPHVFC